ncbi:unnamed protein product [Linum tenue]|uniref:Uncharacterized protein n=1 Tax=Linum tenue TaxID=586396 RepID=A0AAV0IPT8_9ROSI|nr:unnamed protein product [Linum tenue]
MVQSDQMRNRVLGFRPDSSSSSRSRGRRHGQFSILQQNPR